MARPPGQAVAGLRRPDAARGGRGRFPPALDTGDAVLQSDDGVVYHGERHENVSGIITDQYWEFDGTE